MTLTIDPSKFWYVLIPLVTAVVGFFYGRRRQRQPNDPSILQAVDKFRNLFSTFVFATAVTGIFVLIYRTIGPGTNELAPREAFTSLLPVFATWVGTILAHYYTRENFEAAARAVSEKQSTNNPSSKPLIQLAKIGKDLKPKYIIASGKSNSDVKISDLQSEMKKNDSASRILICDQNDIAQFVLLGSTIALFEGLNANSTFDDLLKQKIGQTTGENLCKQFTFISDKKSIADAKAALHGDTKTILITSTGLANEKVEGWITDTDLAKI